MATVGDGTLPAKKGYSGTLFLFLILVGIGVLALAMQGMRERYRVESRRSECEARLRYLAVAAELYHSKHHAWPAETGARFWQVVVHDKGPEFGRTYDFYHCPVTGTAYRGPGASPSDADAHAWLGCCEPGVHGDMTLAVNGAFKVEFAPKADARYGATRP